MRKIIDAASQLDNGSDIITAIYLLIYIIPIQFNFQKFNFIAGTPHAR